MAHDRQRTEDAGYSLIELLAVVGVMAIIAGMGWPLVSEALQQAELTGATQTLMADIRRAQDTARAQGLTLYLRFDPPRGYTMWSTAELRPRTITFAGRVSLGSPADAESDGVTFRENTAIFGPRPGLSNSFGSVALRTPSGAARKITVNITGYTSVAAWTGSEWR